MKNSTYKWIIAILAAIIVIGGGLLILQNLPEAEEPDATEASEPASMARDFTVVDGEGKEHRLSDYFGKPIVLNFWASWCGPCKNEMPEFEEAYLEYGDQIQFMMINLTDGSSETMQTASELIDRMGYTFPVFYDTAMETAQPYDLSAIPVTCFIDARGQILYRQVGMISGDDLRQWIDTLLS